MFIVIEYYVPHLDVFGKVAYDNVSRDQALVLFHQDYPHWVVAFVDEYIDD